MSISIAEEQINELEIWVLKSFQNLGLLDVRKRNVKCTGEIGTSNIRNNRNSKRRKGQREYVEWNIQKYNWRQVPNT